MIIYDLGAQINDAGTRIHDLGAQITDSGTRISGLLLLYNPGFSERAPLLSFFSFGGVTFDRSPLLLFCGGWLPLRGFRRRRCNFVALGFRQAEPGVIIALPKHSNSTINTSQIKHRNSDINTSAIQTHE